jgi:hypothetical protein
MIDEGLQTLLAGKRLRERGSQPRLADSEVLTLEVGGEYLGLGQDSTIFAYFRRHYLHFFPALAHLHRTTFVRQAANLQLMQDQLWQWPYDRIPHDPQIAIVESLALPVCQFTRAPRSRRFRGEAAYGHDHLTHPSFLYRFRLQVRVCWPGVRCQLEVTPGNGQELAAAEDSTAGTSGVGIGGRNFLAPRLREQLAQRGVELLAPFRCRKQDPQPHLSRALSRWRYKIATIFGQLVERTTLKRLWAHDCWHLTSRLLRKALMHPLAVFTNVTTGHPPLHLAALVR